ncbi:MAG: 3-oxoacyl-[acyl-carrier-protein] reductase [Chloroflexota bacterium]
MSLQGKVAVVTGASRGIGKAIAIELGKRGVKVVVNYAKSADGANEAVEAIKASGSEAVAMQADVTDSKAATALIKTAVDTYGRIDILVNNAGTTRDQVIMMMPEEDWDTVITTNLKSTFNCSKAAVKSMMRQRYGRIITISSVSGVLGNAGQTNYSASKAGLIGFTRALAREVAPRHITVNAIAPGFIPTDLTANVPENLKADYLKAIPLGRWVTVDEIAYAVAFLASDEAAYITGQTLNVDGGMAMS